MSSKSYRAAQQIFQTGSGAKIQIKQPQIAKPLPGNGGALKQAWWVGKKLVGIEAPAPRPTAKPEAAVKPNLRMALPNIVQ